MPEGSGPLVAADEGFCHQIVDTFASVGQADRSWTEKVCAQACAADGSLQLAFGIGKYPNRGVMDAYAGVSRGTEQWTVRASRELAPDPDTTAVGPITYEVLEPFRTVRFALGDNDVAPLRFEWTFHSVGIPPGLERREQHRSPDGYRLDADLIRYHHIGVAEGWCELEGERIEIGAAGWVSTRDHSWGVRYMVGEPPTDVATRDVPDEVSTLVIWTPLLFRRDDGGDPYGIHLYYQRHAYRDLYARTEVQGTIEHADGRVEGIVDLRPELAFDDATRRVRGGSLHLRTGSGAERALGVTPAGDTGFHLGTGLYFGFDGHWHGQHRGRLHVEGEHLVDCDDPGVARRIHQMRDCVVEVTDVTGGATGLGNLQSLAVGPHPELGLTTEASFM